MSVERGAPAMDHALDRIGRLIAQPRTSPHDDALVALQAAAMWRIVYDGAMQRGDAEVAAIAARERQHSLATYRELTERLIDEVARDQERPPI